MKKLFLLVASICCLNEVFAQPCTLDNTGCLPQGGLCNTATVGMANHPYTHTYQFFMPHQLHDPALLAQCSGCDYIHLRQVKITGIGGLPAGINNYVFNQDQLPQYPGFYNVDNNDTLGCAVVSGTPLAAGAYPIQVYMTVEVTAVGTPIGNVDATSQAVYPDTMYILPDTSGSVSSFTYGGIKEDCDSVRLNLNALLEAQAPNPTSWTWNISGQTSTQKAPGAFTFNQAGTYDISLRTVFYQFKINKFHITATGGWTGDIEEATSLQSPELYVTEGMLGINTSGTYTSGTTADIAVPATTPYIPIGTTSMTFHIWDLDNGPPFGSQNDDLGAFTIPIGQGLYYPWTINFTGNNANGWVEIDTVGSTTIIDTLHVNVKGRPAVPQIVAARDSICKGDSVLLKVSPFCADCIYIWYKDTITITSTNDSMLYASESGVYRLWVSNQETGCTNYNDSALYLYVGDKPVSPQTIVYNSNSGKIYPITASSGFSIKWYKDGDELVGQTGSFVMATDTGTYKMVLYNAVFPECAVEAELFVEPKSPETGFDDIDESLSLMVFPNPNTGKFKLLVSDIVAQQTALFVADMLGRIVFADKLDIDSDRTEKEIDLTGLNKGVYLLSISLNGKNIVKKVVVE